MSKRFLFPFLLFGALTLVSPSAQAQLSGTDTAPGDACTAAEEGYVRRNASADRDTSEITLICDGSVWQSATGGSVVWQQNGSDIYYNSGNVGIGTDTPSAPLHILLDASVASNPTFERHQDSSGGVALEQNRARGTKAAPTAVIDADVLGGFNARGYDGSGYYNAASVRGVIDGTVSTGIVPGSVVFETTDSTGTFAERARITSEGYLGIGTTSPANTLDVVGTGIRIGSGVPSATTYQLYNNGGNLYWNGSAVGSGALSGLSDVNLTSLSDSQFLQYDSGSSKWVNVNPSTAMGTTTMVANWPDAIVCHTTYLGTNRTTILYAAGLPSGTATYDYIVPWEEYAASFAHKYNSSGNFVSSGAWTLTDCNKSITELYASGQAFNFIGSSLASAAAPAGGVQFNNGSGVLAADSALYWDNTNKWLGIGTASPAVPLDVVGAIQASGIIRGSILYSQTASDGGSLRFGSNNNQVFSASSLSQLNINPGDTYSEVYIGGTVGIGTATPATLLDVNGAATIRSALTVSGARSNLNTQANNGANARNYGPMLWTDNLFGAELGNNGTLWTNRIFTRDSDGGIEFGKYPTGSTTNVNDFSPWMTIINSGNVGIGTASPGQKLTVAGTIESTSGGVKFPDGTTQTTAASGGSSVWSLNGSDTYYNSGNVGIGTTSPDSVLTIVNDNGTDINDDVKIATWSDTATPGYLTNRARGTRASPTAVQSNDLLGGMWSWAYNGSSWPMSSAMAVAAENDWTTTASTNNSYLLFSTVAAGTLSERLRITSTGNVGIGTAIPATKLSVMGNGFASVNIGDVCGTDYAGIIMNGQTPIACVNYNLLSGSTDQNLYLNRPMGYDIRFREGNGDQIVLLTGGNVGIGTASPGQKLTVAGTIESTSGGVKSPDGTTQTTAASGGATSGLVTGGGSSNSLLSSCSSWGNATCVGAPLTCPSGSTKRKTGISGTTNYYMCVTN